MKARHVWLWLLVLLVAAGLGCAGDDDDDDDDAAVGDDDADDDDDNDAADDDDDTVECPDADEDGFTDAACGGEDCNDADETIHPDAEEICADQIDQDCDGTADDGCDFWKVETVLANYPAGELSRHYELTYLSDGTPYIAYSKPAGALAVAYKTAKGWEQTVVDAAGDPGAYASIDVDSNDRLGVAYYAAETGDIRTALKEPGGAWAVETLDEQGDVGHDATMLFGYDDQAQVFCTAENGWYINHYSQQESGLWTFERGFDSPGSGSFDYGFAAKMNPVGFPIFAWTDWSSEPPYAKDYGYDSFYVGWFHPLYLWQTRQLFFGSQIELDKRFVAVTWTSDENLRAFYITETIPVILVGAFDNYWGWYELPDNNVAPAGPLSADTASDGTIWLGYTNVLKGTPRVAYQTSNVLWRFIDLFDGDQFGSWVYLKVAPDDLPGLVFFDHTQAQLRYAKMGHIAEVE
jgi:Putative metal-binding motif